MNDAYKILIKLEADLQGGKDVTQALKEAKTAAGDLGGRYDTTRTKTDALNQSKQRLRDTIKGLSFQIPVLGSLMEKFSSGLGGAVAVAIGAFALIKSELNRLEEALADAAENTSFNKAIEAKRQQLIQLRREFREFREDLDEFSADPNDPQRIASQRIAAAEGDARRAGELDAAAVAAGRMTPEQADDRAKVRALKLADFKNETRENEVANTSIQRNLSRTELSQLEQQLAGMRDPNVIAAARADLEDKIAAATRDRDQADKALAAGTGNRGFMDAARRNRAQKQADIDLFSGRLAGMERPEDDEISSYNALQRRRRFLEDRAKRLDQRGEEDVLSRPAEREEFRKDRATTAATMVMGGNSYPEAFKAGQIAMAELLLQAQREAYAVIAQRTKNQRNP